MDKRLLNILACPICKGELIYRPQSQRLICKVDKLAFAIRDGIPIMLVEEAQPVSDEEIAGGT
jgi:uncharacterized protein YbaR (Trm112 family)